MLPKGFMRIRHYGLFANRCKGENVRRCRELLGLSQELPEVVNRSFQEMMLKLTGKDITLCPCCGKGTMRQVCLIPEGWTLTKITERVAEIFGIEKDQVVVAGKQPDRVCARSILAYWAIRDLGLTATEIGKYLGLSKSTVSRAATRGQKLIVDQFLSLKD